MYWVFGGTVDQSFCGPSVGNTRFNDLVFADDPAILTESLEVLEMELEALHEMTYFGDFMSPGPRSSSGVRRLTI